jgi:hypothetical protein
MVCHISFFIHSLRVLVKAIVTTLPRYGYLLRNNGTNWMNVTQVPYTLPTGDSTVM